MISWFNAVSWHHGTVNAGLRAMKDTHRALEQTKTGFILQISKLNSFGLFGLSFILEEITVNQSFFFLWKQRSQL